MRCQPVYALATIGLLLLGSWRSPSQLDRTTKVTEIANGVTLTQETQTGNAPLVTYSVHIDRHAQGLQIRVGQALDVVSYGGTSQGRETMSHMADRTGAAVAINGDFFPFNGDPTSLEIRDGEFMSEPIGYRVAMGLTHDDALMQVLTSHGTLQTPDKNAIVLNGINHLPHEGETVVLTTSYAPGAKMKVAATVVTLTEVTLPFHVSRDISGKIASVSTLGADQPLPECPKDGILIVGGGAASAPLSAHSKIGETMHVRYDLTSTSATPAAAGAGSPEVLPPVWQDVEQAVGGGPWLVRDGRVFVDGDAERLSPTDFVNARHARSAVGICSDGSLLLVAVDGKMANSRGVTLPEMAEIMLRLGAKQAMNLDGGGSTTLVVSGRVVNHPSDGRERPVANGLLVFAPGKPATDPPPPTSAPSAPAGSAP